MMINWPKVVGWRTSIVGRRAPGPQIDVAVDGSHAARKCIAIIDERPANCRRTMPKSMAPRLSRRSRRCPFAAFPKNANNIESGMAEERRSEPAPQVSQKN